MWKEYILAIVIVLVVNFAGACAAGHDMVIKEQGVHGNPIAVGDDCQASLAQPCPPTKEN